jgi:7,8-dihydropterin-6-yl-methyl-4-(beta-D-ribofuranosyl)aminobenzene 5'-phosphate synthase
MKIVTLVENSALSEDFKSVHGVSFYIETKKHRILFDLGPDETFIKNAEKKGIDLKTVDMAIISHGHNDHGGALERFLDLNDKAKVYIRESAFANLYSEKPSKEKVYIGLKQILRHDKRIVFTKNFTHLDKGVELFSGVEAKRFNPLGNDHLYRQHGKILEKDDFIHEQNLIIKEDDRHTLFSGCAHKGIVNIMDHFYRLKNRYPDTVIGGFHLKNGLKETDGETFEAFTTVLKSTNARFITGHCTGEPMLERLKEALGEAMDSFKSGKTFEI